MDGSTGYGDYFPPAVAQDLVVEVSDGAIGLSWQANTEPDLHQYFIYRGMEVEEAEYLAAVTAAATAYEDSSHRKLVFQT